MSERLDYTSERRRHEKFVGRARLLDRLDQLLVDGETDRGVVITGGPGMGKSALLAAWLARREAAGAVVPHHFIRRGAYDWDDPVKLVGSLVVQIEDSFPDLREPDGDERMHPATRLARALSRVSENVLRPRGERLVVLIDGLDEYDPPVGASAGDPLAAFLPDALPAGVRLLCASRPRHPYVSSLDARDGELAQIDLDDPGSAADNDATVRAFWDRAAGPLGLNAHFVEAAVARADGNVQHAVTLQRHLAVLPAEQRRVEDIPRGLAALLERSWERIASDEVVVDGLGILCAAREALTLDELGAVAGWTGEAQRRAFLRAAKELLVETLRSDGQPEYRLHHDAIRGHIARAIGDVALRAHHGALARRLATWPALANAAARQYALRHALTHRAEAGDWGDAWRVAADTSFLEAKCRELSVHETEADVARVAERCRASGDVEVCRWFAEVARALARESHWLRSAPEAIAALLWNRLRRSGWSADDLDGQIGSPADATFLRVRYTANRASPALVRDLVGHLDVVVACAVTPDGRCVVSASGDGTLKVWDLESGRVLATLEGHASGVNACAVTADGRRVISASQDQTLKVWDLESGRALATLAGHTSTVMACAVTADGRRMVSASEDQTLKVWDLESGRALSTLEGHTGGVRACAVTPDGRRLVSGSTDRTLKVWDLESGRALSTLEGHTGYVRACAVAADGRRVVSASDDWTLKVWDLETYDCLLAHSGDAPYHAVTTSATALVAGDRAGALWVLDWPSSTRGAQPHRASGSDDSQRGSHSARETPSPRPLMKKHTILFLAANPIGTDRLALDREARAIQVELERSGYRDDFEFVTRWAAEPLDLLRALRKLKPTVVHFSGHGGQRVAGEHTSGRAPRRDVVEPGFHGDEQRHGLFFQGSDGQPQLVSAAALEETFGAAGASVQLVVLNACYSDVQAEALLAHIDCVIGMGGSILDDAARSFAIGFYGGLGERESVAAAYQQGRAAIRLEGLRDSDRPKLKVRDGVDASQLVLAADPS
jgi:hypothetical protein